MLSDYCRCYGIVVVVVVVVRLLLLIAFFQIQDLESAVSAGDAKLSAVESQADIVLKQTKTGKGSDVIEQQVLHVKAGEKRKQADKPTVRRLHQDRKMLS